MNQRQQTHSKAMHGPLEGLPLPDTENPDYVRGFWEGTRNRELRIQQCSNCNKFRHMPSPMCPYCNSMKYDWTRVSGRGKVYTVMIARHPVHNALREKAQVPYNICLIELDEQEGLRILSNVLYIAPEEIYIDMPVEVMLMPSPDDPNLVLPLFVQASKK